MSLEAVSRRDINPSPLSSGRSSPAPRRRNEDGDIARKDPKYKRYTANIEKALSLFESHALQEWADYISFLGRLLKAIQSFPTFPQIPQRILVSKRLAQCLNPRLPSGVHQKTLEVYSYIFSLIGRDGLANDLTIWTPGLTPVLSYASLNLKPHFLSLLETFYLPLGRKLRPALKSLILALLPGIDEEGGEYFDQTLGLLESIRAVVEEDTYFWQCFLLATMTSQARRQGALAFLVRKLPRMDSEEALDSPLVSPEPGLLIRCFSAGLSDEQILVQRGFLDLLVQSLPLSSPILQKKVNQPDIELLMISAAGVVLRRDMSLNRRLWVWLLGPNSQEQVSSPSTAQGTEYFNRYGLKSLVRGLKNMINSNRMEPTERAKPSRICLSLLDRWEIGGSVVPELFMPIVRSVSLYETTALSKEHYAEVLRSIAMFFDGVESALIWGEIHETILSVFISTGNVETSLQSLLLVGFVLRTFNVREEEMVIIHAPLLLLSLLVLVQKESMKTDSSLLTTALELAHDLLSLIPERAFNATSKPEKPVSVDIIQDFPKLLTEFYTRSDTKLEKTPCSPQVVGKLLLLVGSDLLCSAISTQTNDVMMRGKILIDIIKKVPKVTDWDKRLLLDTISKTLQSDDIPFATLQGSALVPASLFSKSYLSNVDANNLVPGIVKCLWGFLSPDTPKFHVEATSALWAIQDAFNDRRVEAAIASVMISKDINGIYQKRSAESGRKFSVLWTHSSGNVSYDLILTRPLFLFLDSLAEEDTELHIFARGWLQNLTGTNKLFSIIVSKLLNFSFIRSPGPRDTNGSPLKRHKFTIEDDLEVCSYYLQTLSNVLRYSTDVALASLAKDKAIAVDENSKSLLQNRGLDEDITLQDLLASLLIYVIDSEGAEDISDTVSKLHKVALSVLHQLLLSPHSEPLASLQLENILTARLLSILNIGDTYVQVSLLDVLYAALKLSYLRADSELSALRPPSTDAPSKPRASLTLADNEKATIASQKTPPAQLVKCIMGGFSSPHSRPVLDSWVNFLAECLPLLSEVIFQILMSLVECICEQIKVNFDILKALYISEVANITASSEYMLVSLLNGLEQILAAAHDKLMAEEVKNLHPKSPSEPAGFFGNMVSGVFSVETPQSRTAAANNRLTVLLCFQDTVRICYDIWSWGETYSSKRVDTASASSFRYTSMKLRSRSRRILEHMFAVETLECLEILIELWLDHGKLDQPRNSVFKLINVLDGSRPKFTIPAIFNAIYSRTNPSALEPARKSTLTSELTDIDVVKFLVAYAQSLEDDAMDEIWTDCMAFLKDVLTNPFPHRQSIPSLLQFAALMAEKVDNTTFGEQKKLRKDLGDLFLRLLTAAFTVRPVNPQELISLPVEREVDAEKGSRASDKGASDKGKPENIVDTLVYIVPQLRKLLVEQDRVITATATISTSVIGPVFRSKVFPQSIPPNVLELLQQLTKIPNSQKAWKKELSDAFNDPKFFCFSVSLVKNNWIPLLRQWLLTDRDRLTELLQKLTPPTTAGVIFGVGASSARQEADRKTQLNLRRIAILILAAETDTFVIHLKELEDTIVALFDATPVTSPSSATRADVYLVLRALLLRISPVHLSSFWPLINTELQASLSSLLPEEESDLYTELSLLQACKLLDTLLTIAPDEFQLHEWLFITDTIEAVYRSSNWTPTALADQVTASSGVVGIGAGSSENNLPPNDLKMQLPTSTNGSGKNQLSSTRAFGPSRRPWLHQEDIRDIEKAAVAASIVGSSSASGVSNGQVTARVLRPFFANLSLYFYESTYSMEPANVDSCEQLLLWDLFDDIGGGMVIGTSGS